MSNENYTSEETAFLAPLDEGEGPALRLSDDAFEAAIDTAVSEGLAPSEPRRKPRRFGLLLAAIVLVPSASLAYVLNRTPDEPQKVPVVQSPSAKPPKEAAPAPAPQEDEREEDVGDRPAADEPAVVKPPLKKIAATPADLLRDANELRSQGQWSKAAQAYSSIKSSYPGSAQASVASLAAASLYLEHLGQPSRALSLYQAALRSPGLAAEAELGVANCHRALGNRAGEIAALKSLVKKYPSALFHERVKKRLAKLQGMKL